MFKGMRFFFFHELGQKQLAWKGWCSGPGSLPGFPLGTGSMPAGITLLLMKPPGCTRSQPDTALLLQPEDNMPHCSCSASPLRSCHYLLLDIPAALRVGGTGTCTYFSKPFSLWSKTRWSSFPYIFQGSHLAHADAEDSPTHSSRVSAGRPYMHCIHSAVSYLLPREEPAWRGQHHAPATL